MLFLSFDTISNTGPRAPGHLKKKKSPDKKLVPARPPEAKFKGAFSWGPQENFQDSLGGAGAYFPGPQVLVSSSYID